MIEYYLHPGHAGANLGTATDPWTSWRDARNGLTGVNAPLAVQDTVRVNVSGGSHTLSGGTYDFNIPSSATFPLIFRVAPELRSPGRYSTSSPTVITTNSTNRIRVTTALESFYFIFEGLNFRSDTWNFEITAAPTNDSWVDFRECFLWYNAAASTSSHGAFLMSTHGRVGFKSRNNVLLGRRSEGALGYIFRANSSTHAVSESLNDTVIDTILANVSSTANSRTRLINFILQGSGTGVLSTNLASTSGYGITSAASDASLTNLPNVHYGTSVAADFVGGGDYRLTQANAYGIGPDNTDEPGIATFVPTTDIEGNPRIGEIASVGAHEPGQGLGPSISVGTIISPTLGGFQVRFTTDTAGGMAYYVVQPIGTADPTAEQIRDGLNGAGAAALAADSMAIETAGEKTFPATTGLSANTEYRVAVVHYALPA